MPDQNISLSGSREAELQDLKSAGRRSSSLSDECGEFNRLSSRLFFSKSCDVKASSCADGVVKKVPAVPATCDSTVKASITSPTVVPRRGRPLKTVGAAASAVVKSRETKEVAKLGRKRKAQSPPSEATEPQNVGGASNNPPGYRGVRVRPGVNGFLVEIRPKRWKTTIWLGTFPTAPEAARAFDAGIFYTGKNIPYNFQESEGSFPPFPEHLSLDNFDPDVMEQSKLFVKEQAAEAARRRKVPTPGLLLTGDMVDNEIASVGVQAYNFTSGSACENKGGYVKDEECDGFTSGSPFENKGVDVKDEDCDDFTSGSASENKGGHVKDEEYDGLDLVTPNPFQNLEPLPYDLAPCDKWLLVNDKDSRARISVTVDDYVSAMLGDEDLDIKKPPSSPDELLFGPWHDEDKQTLVAAEDSFKSTFGFKSNESLNCPTMDFWGLPSLDLGAGPSFLNIEEDNSYVCRPQAKKLSGFSFTQHEEALVLCQNWEGAGLMSAFMDSNSLSFEAMMMNSQFGFDMPVVGDGMVG